MVSGDELLEKINSKISSIQTFAVKSGLWANLWDSNPEQVFVGTISARELS